MDRLNKDVDWNDAINNWEHPERPQKNLYVFVSCNDEGLYNEGKVYATDIKEAIKLNFYAPFNLEEQDQDNPEDLITEEDVYQFYGVDLDEDEEPKYANVVDGDSLSQYTIIEITPNGQVTFYPERPL